jgi:hypothetical protein
MFEQERNKMLDWIRQFSHTRYVALLEEEVDRLRAENRALVNSLLGTAGFPPLNFPDARPVAAREPQRIRRRSWHQLQTERELEFTREDLQSPEEASFVRGVGQSRKG